MPAPFQALRKWFAIAAIVLLVIVAAFFLAARWSVPHIQEKAKEKLGVEVKSVASGFTLSKSEAGHTLFTVQAAKAVEYKAGGRAELHDVTIVLYGRDSTRFDQIYGSEFIYDPATGDVQANGPVEIDLEGNAEGPVRPDQSPPREMKNPIHLRTSGLTFNQKTGYAATHERIDFRLPRATGSAIGASFDSKTGLLVLQSQVAVRSMGHQDTLITAHHAVLTKNPRQAVLDTAKMEAPSRTLETTKLTAFLRDDNSIERLLATGEVRIATRNQNPAAPKVEVRADEGDFAVEQENQIRSGVLSGSVQLQSIAGDGARLAVGRAARLQLHFGVNNQIARIEALDDVHFLQLSPDRQRGSDMELIADRVDLFTDRQGDLSRAKTQGAARIEIVPVSSAQTPTPGGDGSRPPSKTTITAGAFDARFDSGSQIKSLHGEPDAKIVSVGTGQPERISTSQTLDVAFNRTSKNSSGIESVLQQGGVRIVEEKREAVAQSARYTPANELFTLAGSPRVSDPGTMTTAQVIRMDRASGDAIAENEVKTTYTELREQPQGALLASGDPIHVTAKSMTAHRGTGTARYSGGARLWQAANIVQAQTIEFNRDNRTMLATGTNSKPVATVLIQKDKTGKMTPVNITSSRLSYNDLDRTVHFEGRVAMKTADGTLTADRVDAFLLPRAAQADTKQSSGASQLDRAVAQGAVELQQPGRHAQGERLVYTAAESKYVLTGTQSRLPSLADATHGTVTGDSLTFYSRDDRVVIGSATSQRTVTQTHAPKAQ